MWNLHADCKDLENSENIWKSFTIVSASDSKQLGVSSGQWWKCEALPVILQTSETPGPWLLLQKGRAELPSANASGSGIFVLSSAKASCWRQVSSFSMLRGVPIILVPNCSFPSLSTKFSFIQTFCAPEGSQLQRRASGLWKTFSWNNSVMYQSGSKNIVMWVNLCIIQNIGIFIAVV